MFLTPYLLTALHIVDLQTIFDRIVFRIPKPCEYTSNSIFGVRDGPSVFFFVTELATDSFCVRKEAREDSVDGRVGVWVTPPSHPTFTDPFVIVLRTHPTPHPRSDVLIAQPL